MPIDTVLHKAAHNGDVKKIKQILEEGIVDVNAPGAANRRPLHRAAGANHLDACKLLVTSGASIEEKDKSGRTALHWACTSGHFAAAAFLIEKGSNIFASNSSQMIPLHMSAEIGNKELVRLLIEKAKDDKINMFTAKNKHGETPYDLAKHNQHKKVTKVLKSSGDPNGGILCCL